MEVLVAAVAAVLGRTFQVAGPLPHVGVLQSVGQSTCLVAALGIAVVVVVVAAAHNQRIAVDVSDIMAAVAAARVVWLVRTVPRLLVPLPMSRGMKRQPVLPRLI